MKAAPLCLICGEDLTEGELVLAGGGDSSCLPVGTTVTVKREVISDCEEDVNCCGGDQSNHDSEPFKDVTDIKREYHHQQQTDANNGSSSSPKEWNEDEKYIFQLFLKWFGVPVKTNGTKSIKNAFNLEGWDGDSAGESFPFCSGCQKQLMGVLELKKMVNELEKEIKKSVKSIWKKANSSEDVFESKEIYLRDARYLGVRQRIVTDFKTRYAGQFFASKQKKSSEKSRISLRVIDDISLNDNKKGPIERKSRRNVQVEEDEDWAVNADAEELTCDDFNYEADFVTNRISVATRKGKRRRKWKNQEINCCRICEKPLQFSTEDEVKIHEWSHKNAEEKRQALLSRSDKTTQNTTSKIEESDVDPDPDTSFHHDNERANTDSDPDITKDIISMQSNELICEIPNPGRRRSTRQKKKKVIHFREEEPAEFSEAKGPNNESQSDAGDTGGDDSDYDPNSSGRKPPKRRTRRKVQVEEDEDWTVNQEEELSCDDDDSIYTTHKNRRHSCPVCAKPLPPSKERRKFHEWTHKNAEEKREALLRGGEDVPDFHRKHQCDKCGYALPSAYGLKKHKELRHGAEEKEMPQLKEKQCSECGGVFIQLRVHQRLVHGMIDALECKEPGCGKAFKNPQRLEQHVKSVHQKIRPWKCSMCPREFGIKKSFDMHMNLHLNIRPYQCDQCIMTFGRLEHLKKHSRVYHSEGRVPKRKPFVRGPTMLPSDVRKEKLISEGKYLPPSALATWAAGREPTSHFPIASNANDCVNASANTEHNAINASHCKSWKGE